MSKKNKQSARPDAHVFFPGGYGCRVLDDLDELYRTGPVIQDSWSPQQIQEMAQALAAIDEDDDRLLLLPREINYARRLRKLSLRAIEKGNNDRGVRLFTRLLEVLHKASRFTERQRFLQFPHGRPRGAYAPLTQWIQMYLEKYPNANNGDIESALRLDPEGRKPTSDDPTDAVARYRDKPVTKRQIRERANECRKRLNIQK